MRTVSAPGLAPAAKIDRKELRPAKEVSRGAFGRCCIGLWGDDAAVELAVRTRKTVRLAEYKIAGRVRPNGKDIAVIVSAIAFD